MIAQIGNFVAAPWIIGAAVVIAILGVVLAERRWP